MKKITTLIALSCLATSLGTKAQTVSTLGSTGFASMYGIAVGKSDTVYVASGATFIIYKIDPSGSVSTFVGTGTAGSADGTGTAASIRAVYDMDADTAGNIYFADYGNNAIRKITAAGVVSTIASSSNPTGIAIGRNDTLYAYNNSTGVINKIDPGGAVSTFATITANGFDLDYVSPDTMYLAGGPLGNIDHIDHTGTATTLTSSLTFPTGIAVDGAGNLFVADNAANLINEVTPAGVVTTFAGSGSSTDADGTGTAASFNAPWGIALGRSSGNLFVSESSSANIRSITGAIPFALPLDWLSYSANLSAQNNACIQWKVKENAVSSYQVLKSTNGQDFQPIGTISSKGDGENNYSYTEPQALNGKAYYRIRQTDYSGKYTYSATLPLESNQALNTAMKVYPTVFKEAFTIAADQAQVATLVNDKGQIVRILQLKQGANTINTGGLSSGNYYIKGINSIQMIVKQ